VRLIHTHLDQSKRHPAHRHVDDQQIQATRHRRQVHLHVHDTGHLRIFLLPASAYETGTIVVEAATGAGATPWCRVFGAIRTKSKPESRRLIDAGHGGQRCCGQGAAGIYFKI